MRSIAPIYVEIEICSSMDDLWRHTQAPELHQQWDLRFSDINYLPRPDAESPQRFLYATRIGFGLRIKGEGESVGEHFGSSGRSSSLRFWSEDPKSLIREGSGYWKYVPVEDSIRFITRYDYRTRFGMFGRIIDRYVFRPLIGWATSWSFDCLRLWIERGIAPAVSMQRCAVHAMCRITLAIIWLYQGLVPKLLFGESSGELETIRASGLFNGYEGGVLMAASTIEIVLGVLMLALWRVRWMMPLNIALLILLGIAVAITDAHMFTKQFNPATLNVGMIMLAMVGWIISRDLPTATACLRREKENKA
jgi:hypothetical protein